MHYRVTFCILLTTSIPAPGSKAGAGRDPTLTVVTRFNKSIPFSL